MPYVAECANCGTSIPVPDTHISDPDALLVCRDPKGTGCCTQVHDHAASAASCDGSKHPGQGCAVGVKGCGVCRSVIVTASEASAVITPGGFPPNGSGALAGIATMMLARFWLGRLLIVALTALPGTILERARQTSLLGSILNGTTWPVVPAGWRMRLTSTAPTVSAAGVELTGSGYTAGGATITSNTVAAAAATLPVASTSWTNASGSAWSIVGIEIWDTAGTPLRWLWGLWNGQPISVANGNTFQVAAGGVTADATAW